MNGEVLIVDEHTGRILAGRRYNEGMHQAIEAKEGVEIKDENQTLATVTLQNYFRLYDKLSGMTGTAETEAAEFNAIYKLGVVPIPTNTPMIRARPGRPRLQERGGQVRRRRRGHRRAPREGPAGPRRHHQRREERVPLRSCCARKGVRHEVLNAKNHAREAVDRRPGRPQGRRHRRHQHGRPRHRHHARRQRRVPRRRRRSRPRGLDPEETPEEYEAAWDEALASRRGGRSRTSTTRSSSSAASTCSAPSGTSRAASTTSCAAAPAARATRASPGSTSRSTTTSCACSTPALVDGS